MTREQIEALIIVEEDNLKKEHVYSYDMGYTVNYTEIANPLIMKNLEELYKIRMYNLTGEEKNVIIQSKIND